LIGRSGSISDRIRYARRGDPSALIEETAMDLAPAKRRDKWGWLPVLFLKSIGRSDSLGPADSDEPLDAEKQTLLRLVAQMLPRCVPAGSEEHEELAEISDRLEVLAGGLPEHEWARSLAESLNARARTGASSPSIRVTWG
jgi:hypothetical protein